MTDAVEGPHEDGRRNHTCNQRNRRQQTEHDCTEERLATGLQRPLQCLVIDHQRPRQRWPRGRRHVQVVGRDGVRRQTVQDTVAVHVTVVVVVITKHVELQIRWPLSHNLELPLAVADLVHERRETLVVAPAVVRTTGKELRHTPLLGEIEIGVDDNARTRTGLVPVYHTQRLTSRGKLKQG